MKVMEKDVELFTKDKDKPLETDLVNDISDISDIDGVSVHHFVNDFAIELLVLLYDELDRLVRTQKARLCRTVVFVNKPPMFGEIGHCRTVVEKFKFKFANLVGLKFKFLTDNTMKLI